MVDKSIIKNNFSKRARSYDDHAAVQKKCAEELISLIDLEYFPRILEIGCGTGIYTGMLRDKYPDAEITAVDISPEMVKVAEERLKDKGVRFDISDGEHLDRDEKVDLITSNASFQWFEDMERAFSVFKGKLSRNGMLCFSMYGPDTFREFKEVLGNHLGQRSWLSSSRFTPIEDLRVVLEKHFSGFEVEERHYTVDFFSIWEFLHNIKKSGARGEGLGAGIFLGKYMIKELEKIYVETFGSVLATHHVYFCRAHV